MVSDTVVQVDATETFCVGTGGLVRGKTTFGKDHHGHEQRAAPKLFFERPPNEWGQPQKAL